MRVGLHIHRQYSSRSDKRMHVRVGQAPLYLEMLDSTPSRVERDLVNILNIYLRSERSCYRSKNYISEQD